MLHTISGTYNFSHIGRVCPLASISQIITAPRLPLLRLIFLDSTQKQDSWIENGEVHGDCPLLIMRQGTGFLHEEHIQMNTFPGPPETWVSVPISAVSHAAWTRPVPAVPHLCFLASSGVQDIGMGGGEEQLPLHLLVP
jgi:hypothetical protein